MSDWRFVDLEKVQCGDCRAATQAATEKMRWTIKDAQDVKTGDVLWRHHGRRPAVVNSVFVGRTRTTITLCDAPTQELFNIEDVKVQVKP